MNRKPTYEELEQRVRELEEKCLEHKYVEKMLKSERDKLKTLIDGLASANIGVDIVSRDYEIIQQNQALVQRFGDIAGKKCYKEYMALEEPCIFCPMVKALKNKRCERAEMRGADGRDYEILSAPLTNPDGTVDKAIEVVLEITDRKLIEKALKESEQRFRILFNHMSIGIALVDKDGYVSVANEADCRFLGYSKEELEGMHFSKFTYSEDLDLDKDLYEDLLKGNRAQYVIDKRYLRKDGHVVWGRVSVSLIKNDTGEPLYTVIACEDIDKRKKAENALRESEERYRAVVESQTEMICRFLSDGTITFINDAYCSFFDKNRKELIGHKFMSLIPEGDQEKVYKNIAFLNSTAPIITHEHRVLDANGEIFWHKWANQAIFDDQGKLLEYQAVGWDITERVHAEEELRKAHDELELRVKKRTKELKAALSKMKRKEKEIIKHKTSIEKINIQLLETNKAMSVLARNIDRQKELLENRIYNTIVANVMPVITELQNNKNCRRCLADLEVLKTYLNSLFSDPNEYQDIIMLLTEQEMRVASLIKKGMINKTIASMLFISEHTVKTHRRNIRKKLKIQNPKVNLTSYLNR